MVLHGLQLMLVQQVHILKDKVVMLHGMELFGLQQVKILLS